MFTTERLGGKVRRHRFGLDDVEIEMIGAALDLLGLDDIDIYLGRKLGKEECENFTDRKVELQQKLERKRNPVKEGAALLTLSAEAGND